MTNIADTTSDVELEDVVTLREEIGNTLGAAQAEIFNQVLEFKETQIKLIKEIGEPALETVAEKIEELG